MEHFDVGQGTGATIPRTRNEYSPPVESRPGGLLNPACESSSSTSIFVACESISCRFVAAMSARNSGVKGETDAGVSFSRELSRLPLTVLPAW